VSGFTSTGAEAAGSPPKLAPERLRAEQEATLATPRRRYGPAARALFVLLDVVYGKPRSLSKFKVLEVIARVPYQAWEQVAYVAVTHRYSRPTFARRIFDRVGESRAQQDNEQWHLLILEDLVERSGKRENFVRYRLFPQLIALVYYHLSWALYVISPAWSYALNVDFEDHAEHEYALLSRSTRSGTGHPTRARSLRSTAPFRPWPTSSARSAMTSASTRSRAWPACRSRGSASAHASRSA